MAIPEPGCCDGPNELLRKILLGLPEISTGGGSSISVENEGVQITAGVTNFDFVGAGVTASAVGNDVTVTIAGGGGVSSVSGTAGRITSTGGATPVIDIDAAYVGQASITTLGTITTGVWNGTAIANANLANSSTTINGTAISLGGSGTVTAAAGTLTGATLNATVVNSSLTSVGTLGTLTVTAAPTFTAMTAGSVLFAGAAGLLSQDNANFFWDDTNNFLGIAQQTPTSRLHVNTNNLGVTQSDASGILLANTTAAISGTQQISPAVVWQGNGFKTNAAAASQDVRFRAEVLPVQGAANPTVQWLLRTSINGGAYATRLTVDSGGDVSSATTITAATILRSSTSVAFTANSNQNITWAAGGTPVVQFNNVNTGGYVWNVNSVQRMKIDTTNFVSIGANATPLGLLSIGSAQSSAAWGLGGINFQTVAATYTDTSTAASGTATNAVANSFGIPTFAATNATVTMTNAANLYVAGVPVAGTNVTLTNAFAIWSDAGTNRFDGSSIFGTTITPQANDGAALGTTALQWSDLFLAEGGVINFDNGDVTITQTGNVLAFAGATTAYTFDAPVRLQGFTVAGLPAGTLGDRAFVTDATAPTYNGALVGGGAVNIPVFFNGAAWVSA